MLDAGKAVLLAVPHEEETNQDIMLLPEFARVRDSFNVSRGNACNGNYTIYPTYKCSDTAEGFNFKVLDLYETIVFSKPVCSLPVTPSRPDLQKKLSEAKQRYRDRALDQDGVRLPSHAEAELRGGRVDDRAMQNMNAIRGHA